MKPTKSKKRGNIMWIIILSTLVIIGLIAWAVIAYLGRSQNLSVTAIEQYSGDLYLIHLTKSEALDWQAGAYAQFSFPVVKGANHTAPEAVSGATESRHQGNSQNVWLTIASNPEDNEILLLTHNRGSLTKQILTSLPVGSQVAISWVDSSLPVATGDEPLICFASDVGVAAIRPIIREWVGKRTLVFNHLAKDVDVFHAELLTLASASQHFTYETSSSLAQSQAALDDAMTQYGNQATYLLAGAPDDVTVMKKYLLDKGIQAAKIHTESFRGLR